MSFEGRTAIITGTGGASDGFMRPETGFAVDWPSLDATDRLVGPESIAHSMSRLVNGDS